jgi:hypothetical protein
VTPFEKMSERISLEDAKLSEIKADLLKINSAILDLLPLETRIAEITNYPDFHSYKSMERNLEKLENAWEANTGQSSAAPYYRAMLALLMRDSERRLKDANFPSDIIALFEKWFGRVIKDLNVQPDAYYCFKKDSFLKDLAVCSLRMIPVGGAWTVELGSAS